MRVHYLKHVPFEGLGAIDTWLIKKRLKASVTNLFQNESLPSIDEFFIVNCFGKGLYI